MVWTSLENIATKYMAVSSRVLTCDWKAAKPPPLLQLFGFTDGGVWGQNDRIEDEAVFVSLDFSDHGGLVFCRAVVMYDAQSAQQSHMDGH